MKGRDRHGENNLSVTAFRDTRAFKIDLGDGREFALHRTVSGMYRPEFFGLPRGVGLTLHDLREFSAGLASIVKDLSASDEFPVPRAGSGDEDHTLDKQGQDHVEGRHDKLSSHAHILLCKGSRPGMPTSDELAEMYGPPPYYKHRS